MKTIFTVALLALLSVGSACSKSSVAPIDITGDWTLAVTGAATTSLTLKADGTVDIPGSANVGTWVLKSKHFSSTLPGMGYQLEGDITSMSPLKIEGTLTSGQNSVPMTLTKP